MSALGREWYIQEWLCGQTVDEGPEDCENKQMDYSHRLYAIEVNLRGEQIGRASCRERVCRAVKRAGDAGAANE